MKKKLFLATLFLTISTLALADSNFAGTYTRETPPAASNRVSRDPVLKITVTPQGKNYTVREFWPNDVPADYFECDSAGACARFSRGRKSEDVKIFIEAGDLVVTSEAPTGRTLTQRRYHLSADGKTLSIAELNSFKMTGADFHRTD
jgi:hypothetical protein